MDGINKDGVKIRRKLDSDKRLPVIFSIRRAQIFFSARISDTSYIETRRRLHSAENFCLLTFWESRAVGVLAGEIYKPKFSRKKIRIKKLKDRRSSAADE
jgi:hypothetical protein